MQIGADKLHIWVQLSCGQRVLGTPTCDFEASSLNITVYLQYLLYYIHSMHIFQCILIDAFFISLNSSRSLKQINAEMLLDKVMFVLETATHSTLARFTGCLICQTFSFSIFNSLAAVWFDIFKIYLGSLILRIQFGPPN